MEHLEIKITQVKNGFIVEKHEWKEEACGDLKEYWIAHEAKQVSTIVYDNLPKG